MRKWGIGEIDGDFLLESFVEGFCLTGVRDSEAELGVGTFAGRDDDDAIGDGVGEMVGCAVKEEVVEG